MSSDKDAPPPPTGESGDSTTPRSSDRVGSGDTAPLRSEASERPPGSGGVDTRSSAPETGRGSDSESTTKSTKKTKKKSKGSPPPQGSSQPGEDPLRGSRVSGVWAAVVALVVLLVLLAIFVLQNTRPVEVTYFGWSGEAPLAAALLIAVAAGLLIAVAAGSLRILQLRRRVKREKKQRP